jgi:diguanylate cyclase (GGDEF)-like protein
MSLQARLILAFVVVAILPVTALYLTQLRQLEANALRQAETVLQQVVEVQQRHLNQEFRRLKGQLGLVASRTQMRLSLAAYNQAGDPAAIDLLTKILRDAMESMENVSGIWLRDSRGTVVSRVTGEDVAAETFELPPVPQPGSAVIAFQWPDETFPQLWLNVLLLLDEEPIGSLHILARLDGIQAVLEDFRDDQLSGRTILLIPAPDGELRPAGAISLLPKADVLLASLREERAGRELSDDRPVQIADEIYLSRPLNLGMGEVLAFSSLARASTLAREQARWLLVNLVAAVILSVLMAVFIARKIAGPIEVLKDAIRRLREGDSRVAVPESYWRELAELMRSFNQTTGALARRTEALRSEVHRRRQAQQELVSLANTDHLTGLINRRHFMELLERHMQEPGEGASLLYLDLDRFKPVNDELGHDAGDEVLHIVADRLQRLVRIHDRVARVGGDEFAVLLPDHEPGFEAKVIAARIMESISLPMVIRGQQVQIGCSVGIAAVIPGGQAQAVLLEADAAMYRMKAANRALIARSVGDGRSD